MVVFNPFYTNFSFITQEEYDRRERERRAKELQAQTQARLQEAQAAQKKHESGWLDIAKKGLSVAFSGEAAANALFPGNPGTTIRNAVEQVPVVGKPAAWLGDALTSPVSLATLGAGSWITGAANAGKLGLAAKPLSMAFGPVATGGIGKRLAGEAAVNIGAGLGSRAGEAVVPDSAPNWLQTAGSVGGGLVGGMGAVRGFGPPPSMPSTIKSAVPQPDDIDPVAMDILGWGKQADEPLSGNVFGRAPLQPREEVLRSTYSKTTNEQLSNHIKLANDRIEQLKKFGSNRAQELDEAYQLKDELIEEASRRGVARTEYTEPDYVYRQEGKGLQAYDDVAPDIKQTNRKAYEHYTDEELLDQLARAREDITNPNPDWGKMDNWANTHIESDITQELARRRADIEGGVGASLYTPKAGRPGLTASEKFRNIQSKALEFLDARGIQENDIGTPIAREYAQHVVGLENQASLFGRTAQRAAAAFHLKDNISEDFGESIQDIAWNLSKYKPQMTPDQLSAMNRLKEGIRKWEAQMDDIGVKYMKRISPDKEGFFLPRGGDLDSFGYFAPAKGKRGIGRRKPYKSMAAGMAAGVEYPDFVSAIGEATRGIANLSGETWLGNQTRSIAKQLPVTERGTRQLNFRGVGSATVPAEYADVVERQMNKFKHMDKDDATRLFEAANNAGKTAWASLDLSWLGIQGLITLTKNPKVGAKAFAVGVQSMWDKQAFDKFVEAYDAKARNLSRPTSQDFAERGLHIAGSEGRGLDFFNASKDGGLLGQISRLPGIKQSAESFSSAGDAARLMMADMLYDNAKNGLVDWSTLFTGAKVRATNQELFDLDKITSAANRATGYSASDTGAIGQALLFAPKFLTSQIELLSKAVSDGSIEGAMARRQLAKMFGTGIVLTYFLNWARGKETEFDPRDSNFLRIRDVGGTDISVFGPWDSLVRGLVRAAPSQVGGDSDPLYLLRSKSSPAVSVFVDLLTGKDVVGNDTRTPEALLGSLLPFSVRNALEESPTSTALGFFGAKSSPLTETEKFNNALEDAGIDKGDLVAVRQFKFDNPDLVPKGRSDDAEFMREVQEDITKREAENERRAVDSEQTLAEFREARKLLNKEKRDRLQEVVEDLPDNANSKQEKWLQSYFALYEQAGITDEVTKEVEADAFDLAEARWVAENGSEAYDFISRYFMAGQNSVEKAYLADVKKLADSGYFTMEKYRNMRSDLTDDQITSLRQEISSQRATDERLSKLDFEVAARRILREAGYDNAEIADVINSGKKGYQSREYQQLKNRMARELLWFNPNVFWKDYNKAAMVRAS